MLSCKSFKMTALFVAALIFCCAHEMSAQDDADDGVFSRDIPPVVDDGGAEQIRLPMTESQEENQRMEENNNMHNAQQLQEAIEAAHANDPKDPLQLASRTLEKAFSRFQNGKTDVSVFDLLSTVSRAAGEPRLLLLRIFELMDKNLDGRISSEEFTSLYMAPVAYPDKALELMFKLHDFDKNGFISQWEYLRFSLTVGGINQNLQDKWNEAGQKLKQQDVNGDGLVDLTEFTLYVVWQVNVGIHNQKQREQSSPA